MGGSEGYEDAAPKDMAFLPLCEHVDAQICRVKPVLSHIPAHSLFLFPFLSRTQSQSHTHEKKKKRKERKKKKSLALFLHFLARDPEAEPGGRETQLLFPAQNLQRLPMKRETVQLDSIVDRQHGYPDSGTPNTSSAADAAQI